MTERIEAGNVYVTGISLAQPSGCSRSAARGSRAPAQRPAGRSTCRAWPLSRLPARSRASKARRLRTAQSASISTGSARPDTKQKPSAALASWRARRSARASSSKGRSANAMSTPSGRAADAAVAATQSGALIQIGAILATGNDAVVNASETLALKRLPPELTHRVVMAFYPLEAPLLAGALFEGRPTRLPRPYASSHSAPAPSSASKRSPPPALPPARTTTSPNWSRRSRSRPTPRRRAAMRA